LLVGHDAPHRASPRALHWGQDGSVPAISPSQDKV
jgi:hypothetical protein